MAEADLVVYLLTTANLTQQTGKYDPSDYF
jgi:hypothetical protein